MNWAIAALLFLSGANLLALIVPFNTALLLVCLILFSYQRIQFNLPQISLLVLVSIASISGIIISNSISDIEKNIRQLIVVFTAMILSSLIKNNSDNIFNKFFIIFSFFSIIGQIIFFISPNFQFYTISIAPRTYHIGLSSIILDSGYKPESIFGPYRFQGIFDEPGTFGILSAAATFWAISRQKWFLAAALLSGLILSQSAGGGAVLICLILFNLLARLPAPARLTILTVVALCVTVVIVNITAEFSSVAERQILSGQVRANELNYIFDRIHQLMLPSGFSDKELTAFIPQSLSVGILRSVVQFGVLLFVSVAGLLIYALARSSLSRSSDILFVTLALSGLMRSGIFDMLIGWLLIFIILGRDRVERQTRKEPSADC